MRATVTLDDDLLAEARAASGVPEDTGISVLLTQALRAVIAADAADRLAVLVGTMPDLVVPDTPSRET